MSRDPDREDLAVTAEALRDGAERIAELEERKLESDPEDPVAEALSTEVVAIAERVRDEAHTEAAIVRGRRPRRQAPPN